jgi:uncharacterized membrane protein
MPHWRLGLGLAAAAGYALASCWMMLHAAGRPWAVAVILGPLLLGVTGIALRRRHLPTLLAALATLGVLAAVVAHGGVADVNRLYVLQHAGIHLALCWSFGTSMRPGAVPMITGFALRVHGRITPAMGAYTRRLTAVWTAYFLAMTALSLVIYAACAWPAWSLFANVATPLSAVALFVGEHLVRYALHPEFERASLADALRAWNAAGPRAAQDAVLR